MGVKAKPMTDEEVSLLEAAAKAVGIKLAWFHHMPMYATPDGRPTAQRWDPLHCANDAFGLMVDLGLRVQFLEVGVWAERPAKMLCMASWVPGGAKQRVEEYLVESGRDARVATCRAIVRAAAEMGKPR